MNRIDLSAAIYEYSDCFGRNAIRILNCLKSVDCDTMRELCGNWEAEKLLEIRCFGETCLRWVEGGLAKHGLRLGMSDEELDEYQRAYENEQEKAQQPTTSGYITCEMIDWEQRRWELASGIFLHYSDLTNKTCIEMTDAFIEEYRQSLNTEGKQ